MTLKHTFPDGGKCQKCSSGRNFHFPRVFLQETLRFTFHQSRETRHFLLHHVAEVKANQWGGATGQASMLLQQIQWMKWLMITSRACGRNSNRKWIYNLKPHFFSYNVCSKMPSLLKKTPVRVHDFTRNRPPQKIGRPSLQATPL